MRVSPDSKTADERKVVIAEPRILGQPFELARIAAADDDIVGLEHGTQAFHDLLDVPLPLFRAQPAQASITNIVFVGAPLLEGQMPKFHGRHDVVDNQGGAKSRAEAEK